MTIQLLTIALLISTLLLWYCIRKVYVILTAILLVVCEVIAGLMAFVGKINI